MMAAPTKADLRSLSRLCAELQASFRAIEEAIEAERIVPSMRIDGVAFYDADDAERIAAAIRAKREGGNHRV